jgi:NADH-quinone oxidoreductase subunit E
MHDMSHPGEVIEEIPGPIEFTAEEIETIEKLKRLYPDSKSAIMPVLWLAQKKWGWLSTNVMRLVADQLSLPYSHVFGVASFYTMYFKKPMGRYHVQVCTNVSCLLRGGERLYDHVSQRYGISHNQRTPDGRFSLEEVECMGACGGAPMVAINEDYHENITIESLDQLLENLA